MNAWESIFRQSRVNDGFYGGFYGGDSLSGQNWRWPEGTWFQARLFYLRSAKANFRGA